MPSIRAIIKLPKPATLPHLPTHVLYRNSLRMLRVAVLQVLANNTHHEAMQSNRRKGVGPM